jgi:hypothetical protein
VSRKTRTPGTIKYISETRTMSFIPEKNKLRLSYFELTGEHEDSVQGNTHFSKNRFRIYVVGTEKGNTIPTASRIRLNDTPLYEYVQNTPKKDPTILLTREEQEFIQENDKP